MAIKQEEIHKLLKEGFPDADIEINDLAGDDYNVTFLKAVTSIGPI